MYRLIRSGIGKYCVGTVTEQAGVGTAMRWCRSPSPLYMSAPTCSVTVHEAVGAGAYFPPLGPVFFGGEVDVVVSMNV